MVELIMLLMGDCTAASAPLFPLKNVGSECSWIGFRFGPTNFADCFTLNEPEPGSAAPADGAQQTLHSVFARAMGNYGTDRARRESRVRSLVYTGDSRYVVTLADDGALKAWKRTDPAHGENIGKKATGAPWSLGSIGPDKVAWCPDKHTVEILDVTTGKALRRMSKKAWNILSFAISDDGEAIAIEHFRPLESISLLSFRSGQETSRKGWDYEDEEEALGDPTPQRLGISSRGLLAFSLRNPRVKVADIEGKGIEACLRHGAKVQCIRFSPGGEYIAAGSGEIDNTGARRDCVCRVWDSDSGKELWASPNQHRPVTCVDWSQNGQAIAFSARNGAVHVLETCSGHELWTKHMGGSVHAIRIAPDCRSVACGLSDGSISVYDLVSVKANEKHFNDSDLASAWALLRSTTCKDAAKGKDMFLVDSRATTRYLRTRLSPSRKVSSGNLQSIVGRLDSDSFEERETAMIALTGLRQATPFLHRLLHGNASAEARRRAADLLNKNNAFVVLDAEERRILRAIDVLYWIGTPEAIAILESIAKGAPEERRTSAARVALSALRRTAFAGVVP